MRIIRLMATLLVTTLAGCSMPVSRLPQTVAPDAWESSGAARWPTRDWYRSFGSDELNALMAQAAQDNLDLAAAAARIQQADARARAAGAGILPQVNAGANIAQYAGRTNSSSAHETDWAGLLSASYEIDFWGRNRAAANAAQLQQVASAAERDTLQLTTLAGVANSYFQVLSLRERSALAQATLSTARELEAVVSARYNAGAASAVELSSQRAAVANAALGAASLQQQEIEARAALALLTGHLPDQLRIVTQSLDTLTEPDIAPGLSAELLARRPDVLMAEANLQAAHADVAAAHAALFPSFTLTASGGVQNPAMQAALTTLSGTGATLTLGANVLQTIFDGGRRRAVRAEAQGREAELLAAYQSAILHSLLDVQAALSSLHQLDLQQQPQHDALSLTRQAFDAAQARYREGAVDYLQVLDAQRTLNAAHEQWSQYRLARLQARVSLCKALGGGWQSSVPTHTAATP